MSEERDRDIRASLRDTQEVNRLVVVQHGIGAKMAQRAAFGDVKFERKGLSEAISAEGSVDPLDQNRATTERSLVVDKEEYYDRHEFVLKQFDNIAVLSRQAKAGDQEAIKQLPYQKLYVELATRKLLRDGILEPEILKNLIPKAEKLGIDLRTEPEETHVDTSKSQRVPGLKNVIQRVANVLVSPINSKK